MTVQLVDKTITLDHSAVNSLLDDLVNLKGSIEQALQAEDNQELNQRHVQDLLQRVHAIAGIYH